MKFLKEKKGKLENKKNFLASLIGKIQKSLSITREVRLNRYKYVKKISVK